MASNGSKSVDWGSIAGAAGSVVSSIGGLFASGNMNRKNRKWNESMYARQRADALADWEMQNAYNSPLAQMQRFRDAGLNPNLIYGRGESGAATAVRSSSPGRMQFAPQNFGSVGSVVGDVLSAKQARANIQRTQAETSSIETSTADKELSLAVRQAVGMDRLTDRAMSENANATAVQRKGLMEAESFMELVTTSSTSGIDVRPGIGVTPSSYKGSVLSQSQLAVLQKNVKSLEMIKQNLTNAGLDQSIKSSISVIKRAEAEIYNVLKGTQMAGQAGQILYAMLRLILSK